MFLIKEALPRGFCCFIFSQNGAKIVTNYLASLTDKMRLEHLNEDVKRIVEWWTKNITFCDFSQDTEVEFKSLTDNFPFEIKTSVVHA